MSNRNPIKRRVVKIMVNKYQDVFDQVQRQRDTSKLTPDEFRKLTEAIAFYAPNSSVVNAANPSAAR